ncbi:MAG: phage portal protein [Actinomycetota bacterium]|nr:phage portal protein [Actinomycetota bacterium]
MPITFISESGELVVSENSGPYQYTPEGFNTGLAANSVPLSLWDGGGASYSRLYETQPWVAIAANFLTRQLARIPLKVYEEGSESQTEREVRSGPLYDSIRRPAPRKGPTHLKQWMFFPALLHGNGGVKKSRPRPGATPDGYRATDWRSLEPKQIGETGTAVDEIDYWIQTDHRGRRHVVQPDDMIHVAWHPPKGVFGVSPLKQLGVTLSIERDAKAYQQALFRNSARPSGGVTLPEAMAGDQEFRRELREDLARMHQGAANAGRPIVLPPGSKWEQFSISAHEAELIDQRKLSREEIAALYNAPQPLIGILDHATYSNIAELHRILYGPVLGPWIVLGEETFVAQVIDGEPAFQGQYVKFDLSEELRGDAVKEAIALKTKLGIGLLTINEGRLQMNMPRIDHPLCDQPMIPTNNMTFIGVDGEEEATKALFSNVARAGERLYRKACAGDSSFDRERFTRELAEDLDAAGAQDPKKTAETWAAIVETFVDDALGEPDQLKASFAALNPMGGVR